MSEAIRTELDAGVLVATIEASKTGTGVPVPGNVMEKLSGLNT